MKKTGFKIMRGVIAAMVVAAGIFGSVSAEKVGATTLPIGAAPEISLNEIVSIQHKEDVDSYFFTLTVPSTGILSVHAIDHINTVEIRSGKENGILVNNMGDGYGGGLGGSFVVNSLVRGGKYSLRISVTDVNEVDTSSISFNFSSIGESFVESETSNNDSEATPSDITALTGDLWVGALAMYDNDDWYRFKLPQTSTITYKFMEKTSGMVLEYQLMKADGTYITESGKTEETISTTLPAGEYLLHVRGAVYAYARRGEYNFFIKASTINEAAKTLISKQAKVKAAKKGKVTISWGKILDVDGYQIQISTKKNFAGSKTINTEASVNKQTVTLKKSWRGKSVYVRVRIYRTDTDGNKVFSSWSKVKTVKSKK